MNCPAATPEYSDNFGIGRLSEQWPHERLAATRRAHTLDSLAHSARGRCSRSHGGYFQLPPCVGHTMPVVLHALQLNLSPRKDVFVCPLQTLQVNSGAPHFLHFMEALLDRLDTQDATMRSTATRRVELIIASSSDRSSSRSSARKRSCVDRGSDAWDCSPLSTAGGSSVPLLRAERFHAELRTVRLGVEYAPTRTCGNCRVGVVG